MEIEEAIIYLEQIKEKYELSYEEDALNIAIASMRVIEAIFTSFSFTNLQKEAIKNMFSQLKNEKPNIS